MSSGTRIKAIFMEGLSEYSSPPIPDVISRNEEQRVYLKDFPPTVLERQFNVKDESKLV